MTKISRKLSCGIDFGTSNSTCAISSDHGVELAPLEGNHLTLPSAIFFNAAETPLFGREAIQAYVEGEDGRLMRGLKSVLGTSLMEERTIVRNSAKSFSDILATYIKNLKDKAEAASEKEIEDVVMGRPVHFHDNAPDADRKSQDVLERIARLIGFKNITFQYEPIAAAFAHEQNISSEKLSLVIDLGGGTSDFTIIKLSSQRSSILDRASDILGTTGVRVGGTNFDERLSMKAFMPHLGLGSQYRSDFDKEKLLYVPPSTYLSLSEWARVNFAQTKKSILETKGLLRQAVEPEKLERLVLLQEQGAGYAFLQEVERTKIELTSREEVYSDLTRLGLGFGVRVTTKEFEIIIAEYIEKISRSIQECMKLAGVHPGDINLVILTGGSSELPIINRMVKEYLPAAEVSKEDKFGSVGLGLAYNARVVFSALSGPH